MEWSRIGKEVEPGLAEQARKKLTTTLISLAMRYDSAGNTGLPFGGDPFVFFLLSQSNQECTLKIKTAATDGIRYYWNPKFILQKSIIGLRFICYHECMHAYLMHPVRLGHRLPKLWNIAVDYYVNTNIIQDLKVRKVPDHIKLFKEHLGDYKTLAEFEEIIKNPFAHVSKKQLETKKIKAHQPDLYSDLPLTSEQKEKIEQDQQQNYFFYADPDLPEEQLRPEIIYNRLFALLPKCSECGSIGIYKKSKNKGKNKSDKKNKKNKQEQEEQNQGNKGDQGSQDQDDQKQDGQDNHDCKDGHGCPSCGSGGDETFDIFDLGGTVDDHIDPKDSQEQMAKKIAEAMDLAKKQPGNLPAGIEEELASLIAPKISWKDKIRGTVKRIIEGNDKKDWNRFKARPLFAGLIIPKTISKLARFGCLLDTSGSMSAEDMAFGISQLQSLGANVEGVIIPADSEIYWDKTTKVRKCNAEELHKVQIKGRGGTIWSPFFRDYEEKIGKCDFLIIVSDMYLYDQDVESMEDPKIPVYWICTSDNTQFKPPFGKIFNLKDC